MSTPATVTPPRWASQLLHSALPDNALREAILGDLHEELVRDASRVGGGRARMRYRQRTAEIVAYLVIDTLRWRRWGTAPAHHPAAPIAHPRPATLGARPRLRRADGWLVVIACLLLGGGIVVNTLLYSAMRQVPQPLAVPAITSVAGVSALILALGSAVCAAAVLCLGPRWVRRRLCRKTAESR